MQKQNKSSIRFTWLYNKIWNKKATGVDTFKFAKNVNLGSWIFSFDNPDVDKLKTLSTVLSKLSNAVEKDVVKKSVVDELVKKFNTIYAIGATK